MRSFPRVVVAMSGGVDSSVAAALLLQQGYEVIGVMLRLWSETGREKENRCCSPDAMIQARVVAAKLKIPFYAIDAQQFFYDQVVHYFIDDYAQGLTPNPCIRCNRTVRWQFLFERALSMDAQFLATGHYARKQQDGSGNQLLLRAVDEHKDQSYVLHILGQNQLKHALFPLGNFTKNQIRHLARELELPVADRPESQDLCFLAGGDYRDFLKRNCPQSQSPGPILTRSGELIGEHKGLAFYTIGQRKGLGIYAQSPYYVLAKDIQRNALIVGMQSELGEDELLVGDINWVLGYSPAYPLRSQIKIRYKAPLVWGTITPLGINRAHVKLETSLRDITPGQAAVFYDQEICLGGGTIQL